jgi:hypothetical protein
MKRVNLRSSRLLVGMITLAGVLAAMALASPSASLAAATSPARAGTAAVSAHSVSTHSVSKAEQLATIKYWTASRRASARSIGTITVSPAAVHRGTAAIPSGKPGEVAGGAPARSTSSRPTARLIAPTAHPHGMMPATSYPYPYDSFYVPTGDYTDYPYALNGAIFFTNNGVDYDCSGTSVGSASGTSDENEVWTAGHCVSNTSLSSPGVWDSFAEFIPAYNGASSDFDPFGIFVATDYSTATNFLNNGDISVDEGAMQVGTNANGQTLGQAVGWDGFAWNYSSTENFTAFGYPVASPYNGDYMVEDIASTASSYTWPGGQGQPLIGIGNPMTGGSSGGAWNIDWTTSASGYINGHNDYKFNAQPLAVYSPYQDSLSNTVRCFGASSC